VPGKVSSFIDYKKSRVFTLLGIDTLRGRQESKKGSLKTGSKAAMFAPHSAAN